MDLKEILQHYKESRGFLGKAGRQASRQVRRKASKPVSKQGGKQGSKHLAGIQSEPCPVGACYLIFV